MIRQSEEANITDWMAKGKMILIQKDPQGETTLSK